MTAALVAAMSLPATGAAQTTYRYTGHVFTEFSCGPDGGGTATAICATPAPANSHTSYRATDFVSAALSFAAPLPPSLPMQDVTGRPGFALTLNDERQTLTAADASSLSFIVELSTDPGGQINAWRILLNTGGALNGGITTTNTAQAIVDSGALACCDPAVSGNFGFVLNAPGTWLMSDVFCSVPLNQATFVNGDTVTLQGFRVQNIGNAPAAIEIKVWLEAPGQAPLSILRVGEGGEIVMPGPSDITGGPRPLFTVTPAVPRGRYALGCRFLDPVTGLLDAETIQSFQIQ
jgi:hypothetical protein